MNLPTQDSGDASPYLGLPPGTISWDALDQRLNQGHGGLPGGSSLRKLCLKMGLGNCTNPSVDEIKQAIQAYFDEHGKTPSKRSGDASPYLGLPPGTTNWNTLNERLHNGSHGLPSGSSIHKLAVEMGLAVIIPNFSNDAIKQALQAYFDEHGQRPNRELGDASPYLGLPPGTINWKALDARLYDTSLFKLAVEIGLTVIIPNFSIEGIKQALQAYFDEHGKTPVQRSGDASVYFGLPPGTINWDALNARLKRGYGGLPGGSSLHKLCVKMGLVAGDTTKTAVKQVKQALQAYFDEHGKTPSTRSGDASVYFGLPPGTISWDALDNRLRYGVGGLPGGSSLAKLKKEMRAEGLLQDMAA